MKTDKELSQISSEIIDFIGSKNLMLTEKFRIVSSLYWSFKDTCRQAGFDITEVKRLRRNE